MGSAPTVPPPWGNAPAPEVKANKGDLGATGEVRGREQGHGVGGAVPHGWDHP